MDAEAAREQMITQQLRAWHVLDPRTLQAMQDVPRESFVPDAYRGLAFADAAIPIGKGQVILPPKIQGRILQALSPSPDDSVLDVGTGTGFLAACLASMAASVRSIEIDPGLSEKAAARLAQLGVDNVRTEIADAMRLDWHDLFDAIAVTSALPVYDDRFEDMLGPGGRLFVVVGEPPVREAWLVTKGDDGCTREILFETDVPPLVNAPQPEAFVF
jgi:protein-L-isoaspartate(D-aspartate) O-methyltransferase